jgi:SAM-dependent methyltransferase
MTESILPLPPEHLRFMREDDERLLSVGRELATRLVVHGLGAQDRVLDVGCGYGRLALGLIAERVHQGDYLGFDILERQIAWCSGTLTPIYPRLRFKHLDVHNPRYNPAGTLDAGQIRFPTGIGTVDVAAVFSVFTHLYRPTVAHYLAELRRVLRPGAVAVTTWLLWDEGRLAATQSDACAYPLRYELDADTRYSDADDPLRAIAFHPRLVTELVHQAGLRVRFSERGSWDGATKSSTFQDVLVLQLPRTPKLVLRRAAGRAKRRFAKRRLVRRSR